MGDTLDGLFGGFSAEGSGVGGRLISAAMAVEGTVILGSGLCPSQGTVNLSPCIASALASLLEGAPANTAAEERAAIEGRIFEQSIGGFRRCVDTLSTKLRQSGPALRSECAKLGRRIARDWGDTACAKSLEHRFARLIATAPHGEMASCSALSSVLVACREKISIHRRELLAADQASLADWASRWEE